MRRFPLRPYGLPSGPARLLSMLAAMVVLAVLFQRMREPRTWQILFDLPAEAQESTPATDQRPAAVSQLAERPVGTDESTAPPEPGSTDLEESERIAAEELFTLVRDQTPLQPPEMHAYWKLMGWSRTTGWDALRRRALNDVPFTQLWEQPGRYRGKLIHLRLHVRRVLVYDAPENTLGVRQTYEAWGWTDDSRSFPYVIVFTDPPPGLPVGTDVRAEVEFVGYFLKTMSYTAYEANRAAPLLVGQIRLPLPRHHQPAPPWNPTWTGAILVAGGLVVSGFVWRQSRTRRVISDRPLPDNPEFPDGDGAAP